MAPVRARRGARNTSPPKKPSRQAPMPRLAEIRLKGIGGGRPAESKRQHGATLAGAILMSGTAIAGAAWIGGSLFDVKEAFYQSADGIASAAGLKATIDVRGVGGARRAEIEAHAFPEGRHSIMAASPESIKAKVEALDWVEDVSVSRLWPSTIRIAVKRREAFALWQERGKVSVIDSAGERVQGADPADFPHLPRVVGAGAGPVAQPMLVALEQLPAVRGRLSALVRVGGRRWNLHLDNGVVVALPEVDPVGALAKVDRLAGGQGVLDGRYAKLDLRTPGRIVALARGATPLRTDRLAVAGATAARGA